MCGGLTAAASMILVTRTGFSTDSIPEASSSNSHNTRWSQPGILETSSMLRIDSLTVSSVQLVEGNSRRIASKILDGSALGRLYSILYITSFSLKIGSDTCPATAVAIEKVRQTTVRILPRTNRRGTHIERHSRNSLAKQHSIMNSDENQGANDSRKPLNETKVPVRVPSSVECVRLCPTGRGHTGQSIRREHHRVPSPIPRAERSPEVMGTPE